VVNDKLYQEVGMVIVQECLNRITDALAAGGSVDDENNKVSAMVEEFFEATRLADVSSGEGNVWSITWTKELIVSYVRVVLQAIESGVLLPGNSRPVDTRIGACLESTPSYGYAGINSVLEVPPKRINKMESFWISETLKYFYLIFSEPPDKCLHSSCADELVGEARYPLSMYVLNTEAHFLPIVGPKSDSNVQPVHLEDLENLLNPFTGLEPVDTVLEEILDHQIADSSDDVTDDIEIPYDPPDIPLSIPPDMSVQEGNIGESEQPHVEL